MQTFTNFFQVVMQEAWQRVLTHRIRSGPALVEYFISCAVVDSSLSVEALQQEAVARGLYRYLGERYLRALHIRIARAEAAIRLGSIRSEEDLAGFLEGAAMSLAPFRSGDKAHADLRIEARQRGLYSLFESRWNPEPPPLPLIRQHSGRL